MIAEGIGAALDAERKELEHRSAMLAHFQQEVFTTSKVKYIISIYGIHHEIEGMIIIEDANDEGAKRAVLAALQSFREAESKGRFLRNPEHIQSSDFSMGVADVHDKLLFTIPEYEDGENAEGEKEKKPSQYNTWINDLLKADNEEAKSKTRPAFDPINEDDIEDDIEDDEDDEEEDWDDASDLDDLDDLDEEDDDEEDENF